VARRGEDGAVKAKSTKPVEAEIAGEMAASLGLAAQRLEKALEALRKHDAGKKKQGKSRARLVTEAAEACHAYVIQREVVGLGAQSAKELGVPGEVWRRMGVVER
jgi:hypothetical protein